MEFARGYQYQIKHHNRMMHLQNENFGLNSDILLVLKLPDSRVLRIISRSLFLAMFVLTLPCIGSILREYYSDSDYILSANEFGSDWIDVESLDSLLLDLVNEGLIKKGDKALFLCSGIGTVIDNSQFLSANEIDLVLESNLGKKKLFHDASFDFVFAFEFEDIEFIDRILKVGGVMISQLGGIKSAFKKQSNYKVVYIRQYGSTIVAIRKTISKNEVIESSVKRRIHKLQMQAKKAALDGLEDVMFEPPRRLLSESRNYLKKFKYLPDLLGDSLEDYPRRVFIDLSSKEEKDGVMKWFDENYPTRNKIFKTYTIETVLEGVPEAVGGSVDVSGWLMKNVKEDEFVVMKATAEVVEEMVRRKAINLVNELFLECGNQWENEDGKRMKRAYWECLALYGRLRDEGIAVHQWWG